ncbi:MAG: tetratricopeptide repeat protein [Desulfuromonadales bacterium]|nr:tetratricopeptide repeat protein [Desulfuromonadales bacterium]NIR33477.1 tetratricopeptide repeat protein [Desulfuromonadales bacterium]NIS43515.1 tetratricopeptide repeat protein [Desulfuromonadales bacterium]
MKKIAYVPLFLALLLSLTGCSATAEKKNEAEVHYTLGVSYLREPSPTSALKAFLKAAELDPEAPKIQNGLGQAYFMKKAYNQAEKHFLRAVELVPDNPQYHNNLAALYLDMNRFDDAIVHFRKAADNLLFQQPAVALTGLGIAQYKKSNYLEAVAAYKKALEENPRYFRAHFHLGEAYYALDKIPLAIAEFREALRLVPDNPRIQYRLALALVKDKKVAEAKDLFRAIAATVPDSELGRNSLNYLEILE